MKDGTKSIELIVVEVWQPDDNHELICAREKNAKAWHHFHVRKSPKVEFGDKLLYTSIDNKLKLFRNKLLMFSLRVVDIPDDVLDNILTDNAYVDMDLSPYKGWENGW